MYNTIHQIKLQPVNDAAYIGIAIPMLFVTVILPMLLIFQSAYSQNKKSKQYIPSDLGERMKYYEAKSSNISVVEPEKAFVIRIDGRAFSKYTKAIKNLSLSTHDVPYSPEFKRCMLLTANSLLKEFRPSTVYTHSDEITLIFPPAIDRNGMYTTHLCGGKTRKLLSLIPSYASVVFKENIDREMELVYGKAIVRKSVTEQLQNGFKCNEIPSFDARLIVFPEDYEIVNNIMWRSKGDCTRNFVSMFSEKYLPRKATYEVSTNERIIMLREKGFELDGENVDFAMKHGVVLKVNSEKRGNIDGASSVFYSFRNFKFSNDMLDFLLAKNSSIGIQELTASRPIIHDYHNLFFDVPSHRKEKMPDEIVDTGAGVGLISTDDYSKVE